MLEVIEKWASIPTYEGSYEISTLGRVRSLLRNKIVSPDSHHNVSLTKDGKSKGWQINVLMGCTFLGNDINDPYRHRVLFRDGNSFNLSVDNLYVEDTSDLKGEKWKLVEYAANRAVRPIYMISNLGRIKSIARTQEWINYGKLSTKYVPEMILSTVPNKLNYQYIWLAAADGTEINAQIHRLVAAAFCENDDPEHKTQVNHIDGNPSNNNAYNLEWVTPSENSQHAYRTGLNSSKKGKLLRYPVKRLETGEIFNSISDVDRAMGRTHGYCNERFRTGGTCTDIEGNVWSLEVMKNNYVYIPSPGTKCYFEEHPDRIYISMGEASRDIGRYDGYVSEAVKRNGSITNKYTGEKLHIRFVD